MELTEIIKYTKEFGILPFFFLYFIHFWHKNHQDIISNIGQSIILYLKSSEYQKPIQKLFIKKDLEILRFFLRDRKHAHINTIVDMYHKTAQEKKKTIMTWLNEQVNDITFIKNLPIDRDIKEKFLNKSRPEKLKTYLLNIEKTIDMNGKAEKFFKELLWSYAQTYIEEVLNDLEQQFLK